MLLFVLVALGAALLLAGCGGGAPEPPAAGTPQDSVPSPDAGGEPAEPDTGTGPFRLTVEKDVVGFTSMDSPAEIPVRLVSRDGFDLSQVTLRVEGLPEMVTGELTPLNVNGGEGTATLRLFITTMTAPRKDHQVKIIAEGGGVTETGTVTVKVTRLGCG